MGFTLALRTPSPIPLEVDGITPERVAGLSGYDVAKLPVLHGNRRECVGDHFDVSDRVSTAPKRADIQFAGDTRNVHGIGRGMTGGSILVAGDVGRHAGAQMTGGSLVVDGAAGDWLGAEMKGGSIEVRGDAGHRVGVAYIGSRRGMTGGLIHVRGSVGDEAGVLMRRGAIVVEGDAGQFAGASMIAGTIVVGGPLGARAGAGMKRGTILALGGVAEVAPGFRRSCEYSPQFLPLLLKSLPVKVETPEAVACYRGDVLTGGRGELLVSDGRQ